MLVRTSAESWMQSKSLDRCNWFEKTHIRQSNV